MNRSTVVRLAAVALGLSSTNCTATPAEGEAVLEGGSAPEKPGLSPRAPFNSTGVRSNSFFVGNDRFLYTRTDTASAAFRWPPAQTALLTLHPTAVSWGPNRVDVFIPEASSGAPLRHYATSDGGNTPYTDSWGSMPGYTIDQYSGSCDATSWGVGRIDVFCVARENASQINVVIHKWYDNGSHGWEALPSPFGATFQSDGLTAASWGPGRLDVWFVDSLNLSLSQRILRHWGTTSPNGVGGWSQSDWGQGAFTSAPDATSTGPNKYDVIVRCQDGYDNHSTGAYADSTMCIFRWSSSGLFTQKMHPLPFQHWTTTFKPSIVSMGNRVRVSIVTDQENIQDYYNYGPGLFLGASWTRGFTMPPAMRTSDLSSW